MALNIDLSLSPLFPLADCVSSSSSASASSSSSSSSSASNSSKTSHSNQTPLSSSNIVSLLLSRPPRTFSSQFRSRLQSNLDKPLPAVPHAHSAVPIPPQAIISLLDLLDELDADVEQQVARVKENIKDTRKLVVDLKQDRAVQRERTRKAKDAIKRETKEIGSDFWLGV